MYLDYAIKLLSDKREWLRETGTTKVLSGDLKKGTLMLRDAEAIETLLNAYASVASRSDAAIVHTVRPITTEEGSQS